MGSINCYFSLLVLNLFWYMGITCGDEIVYYYEHLLSLLGLVFEINIFDGSFIDILHRGVDDDYG